MAAPRVTYAWASAINKVQVNFDQSMEQGSPGNPDDVETLANYAIDTTGGAAPRYPAAVSLLVPDPGNSIVELTLDGEMTLGGSYLVLVENVENQTSDVIDPDYHTYGFVGSGGSPKVVSATALTSQEIDVVFDEPMLNEPALRKPSNYSLNGPTSLYAVNVTVMSSTEVRLTVTTTSLTGGSYTLTVNNVRDEARNVVDALNNTAVFAGIGPVPEIFGILTAPTNTSVRIIYNEPVLVSEATNPANYTFTGAVHGVLSITGIDQVDDRTFLATTGTQYAGEVYDVVVGLSSVHDLYGNPISAGHNETEFFGAGTGVPNIVFTPGPPVEEQLDADAPVEFGLSATGHPLRQPLRINIGDPDEGFSGVDVSSLWIAAFTEGDVQTSVWEAGAPASAVYDVDVQTTTDDAGLVTELVVRILPASGKWSPPAGNVKFMAVVSDMEGSTNFGVTYFSFEDPPTFFEDTDPAATATDTALLTPMTAASLRQIERLRVVLLPRCTVSDNRVVQARTLLYTAAMTELRTLFANRVDFALVDEIRLGDKRTLVNFAERMAPYVDVVRSALLHLPDTSNEVRDLLVKYWKKSSPVYQLSAAATAVVLTVFPEN